MKNGRAKKRSVKLPKQPRLPRNNAKQKRLERRPKKQRRKRPPKRRHSELCNSNRAHNTIIVATRLVLLAQPALVLALTLMPHQPRRVVMMSIIQIATPCVLLVKRHYIEASQDIQLN